MEEPLQLSIIIVNHRAEAVLPECLNAIAASNSPLNTETIIIDNPPTGASSSDDISSGLPVRRVAMRHRAGFAAACNRGAKEAGGAYLLFLNPDVILEPSAIAGLHEVLASRPEAAIVVGRMVGRDGKFQASCRRLPTLGNLFRSRGSILQRILHLKEEEYTLPDFPKVTEVEAAAAAMMMLSKKTFDLLQGFDERFFLYMEDTDLCYRAGLAGQRIFYVPRASGTHYWGFSTGQYRFRRILWHHLSIWRYFIKHHRSFRVLAVLGPMLLINSFLSLAVELFTLRR